MKNKGLWLSVAVFAVLAIVFAFTDWRISQALYNPEAGWANFMEIYGQLPGAFVGFIGGSVLLALFKMQKTFKSIAGGIGLFILTFLASAMFWLDALGAQGGETNAPLALLLGLVMLILAVILLKRLPEEKLAAIKPAAKVAFSLMFIAGIVTVWAIKIPWGRWTYRDILEAGNTALFTPWYLPQGNNGHHSFFSGHTAMAFSVLPILLLVKKGNRARNILLAVLLLWGLIGAMSRIVVGAHFASDVLFGAGETILWFVLLSKKFKADL